MRFHSLIFILLLLFLTKQVNAGESLKQIIDDHFDKQLSMVADALEQSDEQALAQLPPEYLVKASYAVAVKADINLTLTITDLLIDKAQEINNPLYEGQAFYNRGVVYAQVGSHSLALNSFLTALASLENTQSEKEIARIKGAIALIYVELGEYKLAQPFFEEALASHTERNDKTNLTIVLQNQGFMKIQLADFSAAKTDLLKALGLATELGARHYFPILYKNLGIIETQLGNTDGASHYFNQALNESDATNLKHYKSEILREYAKLEMSNNNLAAAREKLVTSFEIAQEFELKKQIRNNFQVLAELEVKSDNYKAAYIAKERAIEVSDTMGESQIAVALSRLDRYTTQLKEQNKRLVLEQEKKIAALAAEREQAIRNLLIAIAVIAIMFVFYFFRRFSDTNRQAVHFEKQSKIDPLTGVWNRRAGEEQLTRLCKREGQAVKVFSIAMLDIDHFKRVNDEYGHDVGDQVIIAICEIIQTSLRPADMLCRWGGEEFIIIWDSFDSTLAYDISERIREKIATTEIEPTGSMTVSIGISTFDQDDVYELIKRGDQALYHAKHLGRNQVVIKKKPQENLRVSGGLN
ncbi:diguanylate cyclase [Aliikangiella marina]|uniref:diguanylate cyclase n=1 Tax=Aliikangiella marina TaxID=1712262 RepID=A0A545T9A8_9GAMM|nr:diguanylate cyclase [Aliikangiella marina]TQV73797.1 diguanylate cyclase [Aliikangiella marina]